jgi:uncharacterized protein involved in exopolysaccharide biosynthesis
MVGVMGAPIYQASAVLMMAPENGGELPYDVIVKVRSLLQSEALIQRSFTAYPEAAEGLTPGVFVARNLAVERNRETNLFTVTVKLGDPAAAAGIANLLAEHVVDAYQRTVVLPIASTADRDLERARQEFESARRALSEFRVRSRLNELRIRQQSLARLPTELATLESQVQSERAVLAQLMTELRGEQPYIVAGGAAAGVADPVPNPAYSMLETRASESRARIAGLTTQLTSVRAQQPALSRDVALIPDLEAKLNDLETAYSRTSAAYADATARQAQAIKNAQIAQSIKVLLTERASPPSEPIAPRPVRNLYLGLAFGAVVFLIAALAFDSIRNRAARPLHSVDAA